MLITLPGRTPYVDHEIMIVSFFAQNIPPTRENIPLIRKRLSSIESLHSQIENILVFLIFWIFILNFIEVIWTIVVAPHFEHTLKFTNTVYMAILRSSINFIALLTVVFKVDAVSRMAKDSYHMYERQFIEHALVKSLRLDIKDVSKLKFTAWFGCMQINRSVAMAYFANITVYSKTLLAIFHPSRACAFLRISMNIPSYLVEKKEKNIYCNDLKTEKYSL